MTLADLAGHRATLLQGPRFVGTGPEVADQMEEWFDSGACDGFVLAATHCPGAYEDVVRLVVPELQRRGVFRERYTGRTLRENLGLERPAVDARPESPTTLEAAVHEPRSRRSELATPASSERMCEKAADARVPTSSSSTSRTPARRAPRSRPRATAVAALTEPGLGPDGARRPRQRPRHAVVPRRHHRGGHGRPRRARRAHRAEGAVGPRRVVGRRPAHPARGEARPHAPDRARGPHRGGRGPRQRGRDRQGQRPPRGDHLRRR